MSAGAAGARSPRRVDAEGRGPDGDGPPCPPAGDRRGRDRDRAAAPGGGGPRGDRRAPVPERAAGLQPRRRAHDEARAARADVRGCDKARRQFAARALDALATGAAASSGVGDRRTTRRPPDRTCRDPIEIDGHPAPDPRNPPEVDYRDGDAGVFLRRCEFRCVRGRAFTDGDREDTRSRSRSSAESMAREILAGRGGRSGGGCGSTDGTWMTVVGVVRRHHPGLVPRPQHANPLSCRSRRRRPAISASGRADRLAIRPARGAGARGVARASIRRSRSST